MISIQQLHQPSPARAFRSSSWLDSVIIITTPTSASSSLSQQHSPICTTVTYAACLLQLPRNRAKSPSKTPGQPQPRTGSSGSAKHSMTDILAQQTPLTLLGPSDKEKKYDRQLRLWAAEGQAALESANILLINSGPGTAGIETLKNLVLPGPPVPYPTFGFECER